MNRLLSLLALCCMMSLPTWATRTVTFQAHYGGYAAVIPLVFQEDGVTLSVYGTARFPGFWFHPTEYSFLSTSNGEIIDIVFQDLSCPFEFTSGTYEQESSGVGHWTGRDTTVFFRPSFSSGYSGPITVTFDDNRPQCGLGNFADLLDETVVCTHDAVVLFQTGYYLYLKDETGYGMVYGDVGQIYQHGDVIPAGYSGNVQLFDCHYELARPEGFKPAKGHVTPVPEEITFAQFDDDYWGHFVVVKDVIYDPEHRVLRDRQGNEIPVYSKTGYYPPADQYTDVYGIVTAYGRCPNVIYQLMPFVLPTGEPDPRFEAIYQNGRNLYAQTLEDEPKPVLIYGNVYNTFYNGDVISGPCHETTSMGMVEYLSDGQWTKIGETPAVLPQPASIKDLDMSMIHKYLTIGGNKLTQNGIFMTLDDWEGTLTIYNKFNVPITTSSDLDEDWDPTVADINVLIDKILSGNTKPVYRHPYTVKGFLGSFKGDLQFYPTYIEYRANQISDDYNGDGEVNLADVNALIDFILEYWSN